MSYELLLGLGGCLGLASRIATGLTPIVRRTRQASRTQVRKIRRYWLDAEIMHGTRIKSLTYSNPRERSPRDDVDCETGVLAPIHMGAFAANLED